MDEDCGQTERSSELFLTWFPRSVDLTRDFSLQETIKRPSTVNSVESKSWNWEPEQK